MNTLVKSIQPTRMLTPAARHLLAGQNLRFYASAEYQSIAQDKFYTPRNPVSFSNNAFTIFNGEDCKERAFVPWELKEATFKNGMGVLGVSLLQLVVPLGPLYNVGAGMFCLNWAATTWTYLSHTVTRVDLQPDGKTVTLKFGKVGGSSVSVPISDIAKVNHERSLVETYEEATLFPIRVGSATYYLHGPGQEAIKNGELFRAVLNGQNIKV